MPATQAADRAHTSKGEYEHEKKERQAHPYIHIEGVADRPSNGALDTDIFLYLSLGQPDGKHRKDRICGCICSL